MTMTLRDRMINLLTRYNEPQRYYHDTSHIRDLLSKANFYKSVLSFEPTEEEWNLVRLSIWYHDAVYFTDDRAPNNEQASADLFISHSTEWGVTTLQEMLVSAIILATKKHVSPRFLSNHAQELCDFFLSLDLSGFADSFEQVMVNGNNIRREYPNIELKQFCDGRIDFLRTFAKRKPMYPHVAFDILWGDKARRNITKEIQHWELQRDAD